MLTTLRHALQTVPVLMVPEGRKMAFAWPENADVYQCDLQ
jgi:hypothetical protein